MSRFRFGDLTSIAKALSGLATLGLLYVGTAFTVGFWPFGHNSAIEINFPPEGYQIGDDFTVELSGKLPVSDRLWLVAKTDSWYPLAEATKSSEGRWSTIIHAEQIISSGSLCAVIVNQMGASEFQVFLQKGDYQKGFSTLPSGATDYVCRNVLRPAKS